MKKITRQKAINLLVETSYDRIDWGTVADILEYGCKGYDNFTKDELQEELDNYFDEEYILIDVEAGLESLTNEEYFLLHDILDYVMENGYVDFEQYDDVYRENDIEAEDLTRKDIQAIADKLKMKRY